MATRQDKLLADPRPLVDRLGTDFFRTLPECPGVYLMRGSGDAVLYVGKAKRLRHRLNAYRVANPDAMKQRTLRLLSEVLRIEWEECESEAAALRREAELLLHLRPRFNRAGVWRPPKKQVAWRTDGEGIRLIVGVEPSPDWIATPTLVGAARLHQVLVRLVWCRMRPAEGLAGMPVGWFDGHHGTDVTITQRSGETSAQTAAALNNLLTGVSTLEAWLPWLEGPVERQWVAQLDSALPSPLRR